MFLICLYGTKALAAGEVTEHSSGNKLFEWTCLCLLPFSSRYFVNSLASAILSHLAQLPEECEERGPGVFHRVQSIELAVCSLKAPAMIR